MRKDQVGKSGQAALDATKKLSELSNKLSKEPILKWPGGKRWLASKLVEAIGPNSKCYYEPFLGGAATFLSLKPAKAVLSDTNDELINAYTQIRDFPELLIKRLSVLRNNERSYYQMRESTPRSELGRAVRLLYLMRLSFNGIHRVNLAGEFNVPYGYKAHLSICDPSHIRLLSTVLKKAKLLTADFEDATSEAGRGDAVYFDPPYTVAHGNNGFIKYNEKIFSWEDQVRLAKHCRKLASRGARVVVSNADHVSIRELYTGFHTQSIERVSKIAAAGQHRRKVHELLLVSGDGP